MGTIFLKIIVTNSNYYCNFKIISMPLEDIGRKLIFYVMTPKLAMKDEQ